MASIVPARRRTPDHPPYALMIGAAIKSLAEEGGSTEESISRFIRSNYGDIPPAHDLLLPYYLAKLTANADFAISTPGRYVVPRHVEGEEIDADIEEGLPLVCDGDVVMAVEALPVKRRRGQPPKERTTTCANGGDDVLSLVPLEPADPNRYAVEPATDTVARKRRRRLPKCKTESVPTIAKKTGKRPGRTLKSARKLDEGMLVMAMTTLETPISGESKSAGTPAGKTGKRRGRPPKSAKKTDEPEAAATSGKSPNSVVMAVEALPVKQRRGRPPKERTTTCANGGDDGLSLVLLEPADPNRYAVEPATDTVARKRRRRLPKCKTESVAAIAKKTGKRPGRPPKSARKLDEDLLVMAMTTLDTPISGESKSAGTPAGKTGKRRGRPPKSAKKTDEPEAAATSSKSPNSVEKTDKDGAESMVMTAEKTGKRRGRPPKRKVDVMDCNPENC